VPTDQNSAWADETCPPYGLVRSVLSAKDEDISGAIALTTMDEILVIAGVGRILFGVLTGLG